MVALRDSSFVSGLVLIIVEVLALMLVEVNAPRKPSQDWPTGLTNSLAFRA